MRFNKEVPGHLVNRMQAAIWREVIDAVVSRLASVEDVDKVIAYGRVVSLVSATLDPAPY